MFNVQFLLKYILLYNTISEKCFKQQFFIYVYIRLGTNLMMGNVTDRLLLKASMCYSVKREFPSNYSSQNSERYWSTGIYSTQSEHPQHMKTIPSFARCTRTPSTHWTESKNLETSSEASNLSVDAVSDRAM